MRERYLSRPGNQVSRVSCRLDEGPRDALSAPEAPQTRHQDTSFPGLEKAYRVAPIAVDSDLWRQLQERAEAELRAGDEMGLLIPLREGSEQ